MMSVERIHELYFDLLKKCLTFMLWDATDGSLREYGRNPLFAFLSMRRRLQRGLPRFDPEDRAQGGDWPRQAHTMVGLERLGFVQTSLEQVLHDGIEGDVIEAGTWRGGVAILMRAVLEFWGVEDRVVWVADSFRGMPKPDPKRYPEDRWYDLSAFKSLAVSLEEVRGNFARYGLLDERVRFLEGWFKDTLPHAPIEKLALMRLDADLYESTTDGLVHLYPKLSPGGYVIIDDYWNAVPCQRAVNDFRREHAITEELIRIDWCGVYWRKGA